VTRTTTIKRHPERAAYDRDTIDAILDEGLVGHAGIVSDGQPYVIPMLYARAGDLLYLHGAPASRLLSTLAHGARVSFTVTLVDGLVLARSAFRHSVNYRSVVVIGETRAVRERAEKLAALRAIVDHVVPGRFDEVREPSDAEFLVTDVVVLELERASAKIRTGPPADKPGDHGIETWAGVLPLALRPGDPIADGSCSLPVPDSLIRYSRGSA
jgi:nitroimidazol reductase NimA-like FMN-containing flavoprotein (pyridoxamine 5'-phosphate oxidase superfamily)